MKSKVLTICVIVAVLAAAGTAQADYTPIFSENWSGDTGHDGSNLNNWLHEPDYGEGTTSDIAILFAGAPYGNILSLNPPNRRPPRRGGECQNGTHA